MEIISALFIFGGLALISMAITGLGDRIASAITQAMKEEFKVRGIR